MKPDKMECWIDFKITKSQIEKDFKHAKTDQMRANEDVIR